MVLRLEVVAEAEEPRLEAAAAAEEVSSLEAEEVVAFLKEAAAEEEVPSLEAAEVGRALEPAGAGALQEAGGEAAAGCQLLGLGSRVSAPDASV